MADGMDQPKEELHLNANEAEHGQAAPTEQKDTAPQNAAPAQGGGEGSGPSKWAPSTYGNYAGEKIESTLGVVGGPVGTGLQKVTAPVGNIVDSAVGGITRAGDMAMSDTGMGKEQDRVVKEDEEFGKKLGGKEQTGQNPLGL